MQINSMPVLTPPACIFSRTFLELVLGAPMSSMFPAAAVPRPPGVSRHQLGPRMLLMPWESGGHLLRWLGGARGDVFCLSLVPRNLSGHSMFFSGRKKEKIFIDHGVWVSEQAKL